MATIDEFISTFNQNSGPAHLNRFECRILAPLATGLSTGQSQFMSFRVASLTFPGKNIRTVTNETVYGPTYEMAQGLTYAESVSVNFYLSANHQEKRYFAKWMDFIYKPDTYNLEYYDNYKAQLEFFQLDRQDNLTSGIKLVDAYPKGYGALEYSQENGELGQFSVEFAFKEHYMIDEFGAPENPENAPKSSTKTGGESKNTGVSSFGPLGP